MLELLAPAGSMESVTAAVQNGADAVYLGYGDFNARRNAKNFTHEEAAAAVSYCHLRGAKVFLTLNTLLTDRELRRRRSRRPPRPAPWGWTRYWSRIWGCCGCFGRRCPTCRSTPPPR